MRRTLALLTLCLLMADAHAFAAQTRNRRTTSPQRRRAPAASQRAASDAVALGRLKVAEKIKVISEFLYVYGGVANQVEVTETQAREAGAPADLRALAERSRGALRRNMTAVRDGLDQLELEFRTTPELERFYDRIAGVAAGAADAEELVAAGQVKPAGRKLLQVVNQLTDALAAMH
ncbi:MAG TPA: hypothetical protein VER32_08010 [Pyrinomonadaceae bacterium]|nr:hypothetical protein [Pyrinomonadaceae bacterium]